jgi:hypothetical protein
MQSATLWEFKSGPLFEIIQRKFKQCWSTFPPISTKQTTTFYLKSLNTKKITTYDDGNPSPGLG